MATVEIHPSRRPRILVVDDDPIIRAFCTKTLRPSGYGTLAATGSSDAMWLTASSADPFDLLVVDVFLPISADLQLSPIQNVYPPVNGNQMVRHMLTIVPELHVLYISSTSHANLIKDGIDLGAAPFLQKPLAAETLLRSVKATLEAPPLCLDNLGHVAPKSEALSNQQWPLAS
jgi:DNA-binding NtrC family response regulator